MKRPALAAFLSVFLLQAPVWADDYKSPGYKFSKSADSGEDATVAAEGVLHKQYDYMKAYYGGNIPPRQAEELQRKLDWLKPGACDAEVPFNKARNPDCGDTAWTCTGDMYEKMTFGKGSTSRQANAGMIRYVRDSIMGDPLLAASAFLFYKRLKENVDLGGGYPAPGDSAGAPIERKASRNLYLLAKSVVKEVSGKDDPYLAMKTLIVFGHDNRFNSLTSGTKENACQLGIVDTLRPAANSNLYLNGAIGEEYWSDDVDKGKEVHDACMAAAGSRVVERGMCGEYTSYQADYYHVVMSAFLHCHCLARGDSIIDDITQGMQKDGYLYMVAKYKTDRFREEIDAALKDPGHTPAVRLLDLMFQEKFEKEGVVCGSAKASVCLEKQKVDQWPWDKWCSDPVMQGNCKDEDKAVAKALAKRYVFEVNLRVIQHFQGILAANAYCRGSKLEHGSCR